MCSLSITVRFSCVVWSVESIIVSLWCCTKCSVVKLGHKVVLSHFLPSRFLPLPWSIDVSIAAVILCVFVLFFFANQNQRWLWLLLFIDISLVGFYFLTIYWPHQITWLYISTRSGSGTRAGLDFCSLFSLQHSIIDYSKNEDQV